MPTETNRATPHGFEELVNHSTPEEEKADYVNVIKPELIKKRANFQQLNVQQLERYKDFKVPATERIAPIQIKYIRFRGGAGGFNPIEVKTSDGQLKIIDAIPTSPFDNLGGRFYPQENLLEIDERFRDKTDWAIRKGTIAHEIQHAIDRTEESPTKIHNITRQMLLQNNQTDNVVGKLEELKAFGTPIRRYITDQPNGETITVYETNYKGKIYRYVKDNITVPDAVYEELKEKYKKRGQLQDDKIFIAFRYANVYRQTPTRLGTLSIGDRVRIRPSVQVVGWRATMQREGTIGTIIMQMGSDYIVEFNRNRTRLPRTTLERVGSKLNMRHPVFVQGHKRKKNARKVIFSGF